MRQAFGVWVLLLAACGNDPPPTAVPGAVATPVAATARATKGDPVEGARVARRVGCDGCHSEGGKGGGFDIRTPEGDRFVAPNLTERRALYDDAALARLMHEGKTHDGHRALGMPIFMLQHLSHQEVRDITAWLRALPAVDNPGLAATRLTPATARKFENGTHPYNDDDKPDPGNTPPDAPPSDPLALGRHLAMTSCTECHGRDLTGWGPEDDAPSLVLVNKAYTAQKFARLMRTGEVAAGGKSKTGFMTEVATYRFAKTLTDAEIAALKQYLDSR